LQRLADTFNQYIVIDNVKTAPRAKTMALDPKPHRVFLSTTEDAQFEVLVLER
jgi:hypothetical protein